MLIESALNDIPDFKFVGLLYQLCARMVTASSVTGGKFSNLLENLILKIGTNHPYHTLPIILALVNSNADENMEKTKKVGQVMENSNIRSKMAKKVLEKLKQRKPQISEIAKTTEQLSLALIQLAYKKPENEKKNVISRSDPLMKLKYLEHILLPTHTLPVHRGGNGKNLFIYLLPYNIE